MTDKSEWQEANRRLNEEERRTLGEPPTAEELLAYCRGELTGSEEERIRDLLVAYPNLARMYAAPVPDAPRPGDADAVPDEEIQAGWSALQQRLGASKTAAREERTDRDRRADVQRGRIVFRQYLPTTIAAALALIFFGLYVQAEARVRSPFILGEAQELVPGGMRGAGGPPLLRRDGDAYLLRPRLMNRVRYPHYAFELHDARGAVIWTKNVAQPGEDETLLIGVPHEFLRAGQTYQLRVFGLDGDTRTGAGTYDLAVPGE